MTITAAFPGRHTAKASTENGIQAASATYASDPGTEGVYSAPTARAPEAGLNRVAWRGSTITGLGQVASAAIRLGANLIITRLLLPEHFGLMALVTVFLVGLHLFSDIGIGPNIIQSQRGEDPRFLDTAWTVQAVRGALLWLAACVLGWPLARLYDHAALVWLLPVAGLTALVGGLESSRVHVLNRRLAFWPITLLDLGAQLLSVLVMIGVALVWRSVWALVISNVASAVFRTVLSHTMLGGARPRWAWDRDARRTLFAFGRWIFVSTALGFLAAQSDRLILGKLVTVEQLGLYAIAASLAAMPLQFAQKLGQAVFFPVVAAAMRRRDHDIRAVRTGRAKLLWALMPVVALGVAVAPELVRLLYRPTFHAVGPLAALLLLGAWLGIVSTSYGVVLLAAGRPRALCVGLAVKLVLLTGLVAVVAPRFGLAGVALVVGLSELGTLVVNLVASRDLHAASGVADLAITAVGAVLVVAFMAGDALALRLTGSPVAAIAAVGIVGLGTSAVLFRKLRLT